MVRPWLPRKVRRVLAHVESRRGKKNTQDMMIFQIIARAKPMMAVMAAATAYTPASHRVTRRPALVTPADAAASDGAIDAGGAKIEPLPLNAPQAPSTSEASKSAWEYANTQSKHCKLGN